MRTLFKTFYIIIGILLAIFIVVKISRSFKTNPSDPNATTELEQYTSQLKGLQKKMKVSVKMQELSGETEMLCILNNNNSDPNSYPSIKGQIAGIVAKVNQAGLLNPGIASDDSVKDYKTIDDTINEYIGIADNLLSCKDYCFQGVFTDPNNNENAFCSCEYQDPSGEDYYFPILSNSSGKNKIYCWTDECDASQNKKFIAGSDPKNPQSNQCVCLPGFSPDGNGNCVNKEDQELTDLTTQIKTNTTNLTTNLSSGFFFCKPTDGKGNGDIIVTELETLKNKAAGLINNVNISKDTMNNYDTAQKAADDAITIYNALPTCVSYCGNTATYDEKNNICKCNDQNSNFNKDKKSCSCNTGYNLCPGPQCEKCDDILNSDTASLKNNYGYIQSTILNDITNIGKLTIPGKSVRINIQPYSTIKNIPVDKNDIKQLSANTIRDCSTQLYNYMPKGFKSFSFSPETGSCILYNPQNASLTKPDNTTMYGYP